MKFIISLASSCETDLGSYNSLKDDSRFIHITCQTDEDELMSTPLEDLNREFGPHSRNYAYTFENSAPHCFAASTAGSGRYPVSSHVMSYLVDTDGHFTTAQTSNESIGGLFVSIDDLSQIETYIDDHFPEAYLDKNIQQYQYRQ